MRLLSNKLLRFATIVVPLAACVATRAVTIAEHVEGTFLQSSADFRGQSFTTAGTAAFSFQNIAFNFFGDAPVATPNRFATNPYAVGVGLLFSMPVPTPSDVKTTSPGFLGAGTATGGFYVFDPGLVLIGSTQYYFYIAGLSSLIVSGGNYDGGTGYIASGGFSNLPYAAGGSFNFRVTGNHVPDAGATALMLSLGVVCLAGMRKLFPARFSNW